MEFLIDRFTDMKSEFVQLFGESNEELRCFRSPGRVNLIGEHTDYNGGLVMPAAIDYSTLAVCRKRSDNILRLISTDVEPSVEVSLSDLVREPGRWADYPIGVVIELQKLGKVFKGIDILFSSNLPQSSGLSSSASLEMAMAVAMNALYNLDLSQVELVKLSQAAENNFVGVKCGIMDQYAVGMGKAGSAIRLDCKAISHNYVSVNLDGYTLLVINTNKPRGLVDSKYNERRAQCEEGLSLLQKALPAKTCLGEISVEEYEANKTLIVDLTIRKRVEHVIYEDERVCDAMKAFATGDTQGVVKAMTGSHESLRNLYEVTGKELDTLYTEGMKAPGALAVRMTGAGFGGCAVAFVKNELIDAFQNELSSRYTEIIGYSPSFYPVNLVDGTNEVKF